MKDSSAYANLVDRCFGAGSSTIDSNSNSTNEVISALNCKDDFAIFRRNFRARLRRLAIAYPREHKSFNSLIVQVNEIASPKNWPGAFAELAAYDYFAMENGWVRAGIELNKDIDGTRTYARECGRPGPANLDIYFSALDIYADVKVLKDNVDEILEGIYRDAFAKLQQKPRVLPQRSRDMPSCRVSDNRSKLIHELKEATTADQQPTFVKSNVVPGLAFLLRWGGPSASTATASYCPYRHAEGLHPLAFKHANKYLKDRPCFLIYVNFPWYNNTITNFLDCNRIFYRSFARRVFIQYQRDKTPFSTIQPKYTGSESIGDVARKLSGLLFLEDQTITAKRPIRSCTDGFLYVNPNADQPLLKSIKRSFFHGLQSTEIDTFEHDNY